MNVWLRTAAALGLMIASSPLPAAAQSGPQKGSASSAPSIGIKVGTLDVRDLTFALPDGGKLSIGRIGFSGLDRNDQRARADRIDFENVVLTSGTQSVEIPALVMTSADIPAQLFRTMTAGEATPDLAAALTATVIDRIDVARIVQRDETVQIEAVHRGLAITGLKDGLFASARIAGSSATTPGNPGMPGPIKVTSGEIRYQQFNFAEMVRMFTGGGSGDAKRVLQNAVVDGFEISTEQGAFRVKRAEMNDIDARAPTLPLPMMNLKVQAGVAPLDPELQKRMVTAAGEIIRFVRIGRYSLEGISVTSPFGTLSIGGIALTGFSSRGIDRFAISDFDLNFPGAPVRFERFEIEGIKYGPLLDLALDAAKTGAPPDLTAERTAALIPRLAAIRLSRLAAETPQGPLMLGNLKFEFAELSDGASSSSSIEGLRIDLTRLDGADGREQLMALGYKQIVAGAQARLSLQRKAQTLNVQPVGVSIDDVGKIEIVARLDGVDADKALADPNATDRVMRAARLGPVEIRITDLGFAERFYADAAKNAGLSPDAIRAGLAAEMRSQAIAAFGPLLGPGSADAIASFLQSPGTIIARVTPANGQPPLSLGEIEALGPAAMERITVTLQAAPK